MWLLTAMTSWFAPVSSTIGWSAIGPLTVGAFGPPVVAVV